MSDYLRKQVIEAEQAGAGENEDVKKMLADHDKLVEEIFQHEDKDKNGFISHDEFSGPKHDELWSLCPASSRLRAPVVGVLVDPAVDDAVAPRATTCSPLYKITSLSPLSGIPEGSIDRSPRVLELARPTEFTNKLSQLSLTDTRNARGMRPSGISGTRGVLLVSLIAGNLRA